MQPLVSICIPTYNRADCLKQTIESIIHQPEFLDGRVEIVVSDNASTDTTGEVCKQYSNIPNFYYFRNPVNILDKNFPIVLSKAHGKLRKLNNDTFLFADGALRKLCEIVDKYDQSRPFVIMKNQTGDIKELNFHDFVLAEGYWVTWIANFTIWENECEHIEDDHSGCELRLWQVKKAYELAHKKNSVVFYCAELGNSITPPKKDISYGLYKIFYCNYMELLKPYVDNGSLSIEDIEFLEKELLFDFFQSWLIDFELRNSDMKYSKEENLKSAIIKQYENKPYWNEFLRSYKKKLVALKTKIFIKKVLGRA